MACITEAAVGFPERQRAHPAGVRHARRDAGRAGLQHGDGRQVAPVRRGRDEPGLHQAQLAASAAASTASTASSARRPTSGIRTWSTTTTRSTSRRTPEQGYHLSVDLTDKAIEFIDDVKAIAPDRPVFLYYAPGCGARAAPGAAGVGRPLPGPVRRRATRRLREQILARQKEMGLVPQDTELPPLNPIGTPETRTGPDGKPFPALDFTKPWDSLSGDEKRLFARMAEVYAGFLSHCRRTRSAGCWTTCEDIDQLDNTIIVRGLRQRRQRRGRPERLGQREQVRSTASPTTWPQNLAMLDELGGTEDLQPLPDRVGDGVQHPVQDVEALLVQRRHLRPVHHLLAGGHRRPRRDPRPVPPRHRPRPDRCWTASGSSSPTTVKGVTQIPIQGVSMRYSFDAATIPTAKTTQFYSMLGTRGIWHDGWKAVTTHPAHQRLGPLRPGHLGALPHRRSTAPSCTTWPPRSPGGSPS